MNIFLHVQVYLCEVWKQKCLRLKELNTQNKILRLEDTSYMANQCLLEYRSCYFCSHATLKRRNGLSHRRRFYWADFYCILHIPGSLECSFPSISHEKYCPVHKLLKAPVLTKYFLIVRFVYLKHIMTTKRCTQNKTAPKLTMKTVAFCLIKRVIKQSLCHF